MHVDDLSSKSKEREQIFELQQNIISMPESEDDWSPGRVCEAIDSDGSGTIDKEELSLAMSAVLGKSVSDEDVAKFMHQYDTNGDGVLDLMEFTDFVKDMSKKK